LIALPDPGVAPVILPVIVPMAQVNDEGVLDVNDKAVFDPEQILAVELFVTAGRGLTVTVIVCAEPWQLPVDEVGVMIYCTVPAVALLGLVKV
jgi:hypothetical protein